VSFAYGLNSRLEAKEAPGEDAGGCQPCGQWWKKSEVPMTGFTTASLFKYLTETFSIGPFLVALFWLGWPLKSACALRFFSDMIVSSYCTEGVSKAF
jgi:hypothetical protein